jgi:hypothetical protein
MPDGETKSALRDFTVALDEIASNLAFLRSSSKLRPRLSPFLNWPTLKAQADARALVDDFLGQKSQEFGAHYRGMIIVIAAAFEEFIRRIVHDRLSQIARKASSYDEVPEKLKVQNIMRTGRVLASWAEPRDHMRTEYQVLAKNLATCVPGAASFDLNVESFTYFITTVSPSVLESLWELGGRHLNWDAIGKNKDFETLLGSKGTRDTGKAVAQKLQDFVRLRNIFAHTGAGGVTVSDTDVDTYLKFLKTLTGELARTLAEG